MAVHNVPVSPSTPTKANDLLSKVHPLPLENGDRLTRREFEQRYAARTDLKKAELIEGVVYMPSPVHFAGHGEPHLAILTWLGTYCAFTPGVRAADNATIRLDLDNEPQPDALLRIEPEAGGRSHLSEDDYVEGAPELVVEIAASSATYDMHDKLRAYRRNGVQEYLVWRVYEKQIDWFVLVDDEYMPLTAALSGIFHSRTFPGLGLAVDALLAGDVARVLAELQKGLGTPEHAEFVDHLQTKP
jgi:Uma2 family endonuclease